MVHGDDIPRAGGKEGRVSQRVKGKDASRWEAGEEGKIGRKIRRDVRLGQRVICVRLQPDSVCSELRQSVTLSVFGQQVARGARAFMGEDSLEAFT